VSRKAEQNRRQRWDRVQRRAEQDRVRVEQDMSKMSETMYRANEFVGSILTSLFTTAAESSKYINGVILLKQPREKTTNHYRWLDNHFPAFVKKLEEAHHYPDYGDVRGLISAHGDKCYCYKSRWEKAGLHFYHGVAIFLLTYLNPWSDEVCETKDGCVDTCDWILSNRDKFLPFLDKVEE
jgi:hypothetical protein